MEAVLRIQNGEMNAFDPAYVLDVAEELQRYLNDDAIRAIVITGRGKAFSAGADVAAMHEAAKQGRASQWVLDATAALHPILVAMQESPKPCIAAVNGVAAGGGLGLALAADMRIGCPESRFAAGYFGIGLAPDGGSTWFLPRLIGVQRARKFFFENEVMDAKLAHRLGVLDEIVPTAALLDRALELAQGWGKWGRHSRLATKQLLASSLQTDCASQLDMERERIAAAAGADDFLEGTEAFVQKKVPRFA